MSINVLDHDVYCDGRDDTDALSNVLRDFVGQAIHFPEGRTCRITAPLTVGTGTSLYSEGSPLQNPPGAVRSGGTVLQFARGVSPCLTLTSASAVFGAHLLRGIGLVADEPTPGGIGLLIKNTYDTVLENVAVYNFANAIKLQATFAAGISARFDNVETGRSTESDLIIDSWPEVRISKMRFGCNGDSVIRSSAYIVITGGGPGPNTVYVTNSQFNAGNGGARCFVLFCNLGVGQYTGLVSEFVFTTNHFESGFANEAGFMSDNSTAVIHGLSLVDNKFLNSGLGNPFWALHPHTESWYWIIANNKFSGWKSFSLYPDQPFRNLSMTGNIFENTPVYINAPKWSVVQAGPNIYEGLTIEGDFYKGRFSGINLGPTNNLAIGDVKTDF